MDQFIPVFTEQSSYPYKTAVLGDKKQELSDFIGVARYKNSQDEFVYIYESGNGQNTYRYLSGDARTYEAALRQVETFERFRGDSASYKNWSQLERYANERYSDGGWDQIFECVGYEDMLWEAVEFGFDAIDWDQVRKHYEKSAELLANRDVGPR